MLRYADYDIVFQEIPDEVSLAINLSNCPNGCKGCHSPYLMQDVGEVLTEESLSVLLEKYGEEISCVCFMGGDADPKGVQRMAEYVKEKSDNNIKAGWYSGKQELPDGIDINAFNYIKLGPYMEQFGGLKSPATNQRLYKIEAGEMKDITYRFRSSVF